MSRHLFAKLFDYLVYDLCYITFDSILNKIGDFKKFLFSNVDKSIADIAEIEYEEDNILHLSDQFQLSQMKSTQTGDLLDFEDSFKMSANGSTKKRKKILRNQPLVEYWRLNGYNYTAEEAQNIRQVIVQFKSNNKKYSFPADKVYRFNAKVFLPPETDYITGDDTTEGKNLQHVYPWFLPIEIALRDLFVCRSGYVFLTADYKQV